MVPKKACGKRRLIWTLVMLAVVVVVGGGVAGVMCWSYWNPTRWSDRYDLDVKLIPPAGKQIVRVSYYVDPTAYFGDQDVFWKRQYNLLYEKRHVTLTADNRFTVDVKCGGRRWLGGDNGYYQRPRYMLLLVVYDEGRFLHLLDVPGYDFQQPSMVIDLANPPDGPLERRAARDTQRQIGSLIGYNSPIRQPASHSERWFPWAGIPPASLIIRARCMRFHVMNVVFRFVKSFSGPPDPGSR